MERDSGRPDNCSDDRFQPWHWLERLSPVEQAAIIIIRVDGVMGASRPNTLKPLLTDLYHRPLRDSWHSVGVFHLNRAPALS